MKAWSIERATAVACGWLLLTALPTWGQSGGQYGACPAWQPGSQGYPPGFDACPPCDDGNAARRGGCRCDRKKSLCCCHKPFQSPGYQGPPQHCGHRAPEYPVPFSTPRPTTPTYLWYPPMMPHNSLPHYRANYAFRHGPGLARTTVSWRPAYLEYTFDKLHNIIELPR